MNNTAAAGGGLVAKSCPTRDPVDCGPLSMGFSRQEYWSGLPFSSPGEYCCHEASKPEREDPSQFCLLVFVHFGISAQHAGSWFPDQGLNPRTLKLKCGMLTTGPPGKSPGQF